MAVSSSIFTLVFFKQASMSKPGVEQRYVGSNSYSFKHKVLNCSKVSAN